MAYNKNEKTLAADVKISLLVLLRNNGSPADRCKNAQWQPHCTCGYHCPRICRPGWLVRN